MTTDLDDALEHGEGTERPFHCHLHEDHQASASVNVVKGVWYCHGCRAAGFVDRKKRRQAPRLDLLAAMLEPEEEPRAHPERWLDLFAPGLPGSEGHYWAGRFPAHVRWFCGLGQDPFTGDAVYPVRTPSGVLAGVARRPQRPADGPRYHYPRRWSASRSLGGWRPAQAREVVVLVEGMADAAALVEVGATALCCYGCGLHRPQRELLARTNPRLVLLGFDADPAGDRAADRTAELLDSVECVRVRWSAKDPAELPPAARLADLAGPVGGSDYGRQAEVLGRWAAARDRLEQAHRKFVEEET